MTYVARLLKLGHFQEASNALYGLQFMDPELSAVKQILAVLSLQVTSSTGEASVLEKRRRTRHPVNPLETSGPCISPGWLRDAFGSDGSGSVPNGNGGRSVGYGIDLGCDMGGFARALAQQHHLRVIGLEMRPHAVAFARARAQEEGLQNVVFLQVGKWMEMVSSPWKRYWQSMCRETPMSTWNPCLETFRRERSDKTMSRICRDNLILSFPSWTALFQIVSQTCILAYSLKSEASKKF